MYPPRETHRNASDFPRFCIFILSKWSGRAWIIDDPPSLKRFFFLGFPPSSLLDLRGRDGGRGAAKPPASCRCGVTQCWPLFTSIVSACVPMWMCALVCVERQVHTRGWVCFYLFILLHDPGTDFFFSRKLHFVEVTWSPVLCVAPSSYSDFLHTPKIISAREVNWELLVICRFECQWLCNLNLIFILRRQIVKLK